MPSQQTILGNCPPLVEDNTLVETFFRPDAVYENLDSYWSLWHPHWPVIHRPTFDSGTVSPFLLAAMAVIGGRYSPNCLYQEQARSLYDLIEILVFTALDTAIDSIDNGYASSAEITASQLLEILQAAYLVVVYQNWDGSPIGRRRIRRQRFSQVVEASQLLCQGGMIHQDYRQASFTRFSWSAFVCKEQMIR